MQQDNQKIIVAVRKAKSSLEKILTAIENGDSKCFPIIHQNLAVIGLLKSANLLMLEKHMQQEAAKFEGKHARRFHEMQKDLLKIVQTAQNK